MGEGRGERKKTDGDNSRKRETEVRDGRDRREETTRWDGHDRRCIGYNSCLLKV